MWLNFYLNSENPDTFFNASASAKASGYRAKTDDSFRSIGHKNYKRLQDQIEKWIDEEGLSEIKLKLLLIEGLQALETKFFAFQGEVVEEKEVIPWHVREKYLELALKVKGMFAPEKKELTGPGGGPIEHSHSVKESMNIGALENAIQHDSAKK